MIRIGKSIRNIHIWNPGEVEIRCVFDEFDDNWKISLVKSLLKSMLWVLIRIASPRRF